MLNKERRGEYLGSTVQVIPHITNEIKSKFYREKSPEEDTISILISMERALFMLILIRMDIIKDCHGIFMGIIGLSAMV